MRIGHAFCLGQLTFLTSRAGPIHFSLYLSHIISPSFSLGSIMYLSPSFSLARESLSLSLCLSSLSLCLARSLALSLSTLSVCLSVVQKALNKQRPLVLSKIVRDLDLLRCKEPTGHRARTRTRTHAHTKAWNQRHFLVSVLLARGGQN